MFANMAAKRTGVRREPDKIWNTRLHEFDGLLAWIGSLNKEVTRPLLVAHFPATFRAFADLLTSRAVAFESYTTPFEGSRLGDLSEYRLAKCVLLALAQALPVGPPSRLKQITTRDVEINILVVEHHPLPSLDDRIWEFAGGLPCPSRLGFYDALDGAFMRQFGGDQIAQLMARLGLSDSECISSPMVDRTIRSAQQRIARRVSNPMTTDSAEQWFQQHLPGEK